MISCKSLFMLHTFNAMHVISVSVCTGFRICFFLFFIDDIWFIFFNQFDISFYYLSSLLTKYTFTIHITDWNVMQHNTQLCTIHFYYLPIAVFVICNILLQFLHFFGRGGGGIIIVTVFNHHYQSVCAGVAVTYCARSSSSLAIATTAATWYTKWVHAIFRLCQLRWNNNNCLSNISRNAE